MLSHTTQWASPCLSVVTHGEVGQIIAELQAPGTADLTAWVDFSALRQAVNDRDVGVRALGPMFQGHFLLANGVEARVDALLQVRCDITAGHLGNLVHMLLGSQTPYTCTPLGVCSAAALRKRFRRSDQSVCCAWKCELLHDLCVVQEVLCASNLYVVLLEHSARCER